MLPVLDCGAKVYLQWPFPETPYSARIVTEQAQSLLYPSLHMQYALGLGAVRLLELQFDGCDCA